MHESQLFTPRKNNNLLSSICASPHGQASTINNLTFDDDDNTNLSQYENNPNYSDNPDMNTTFVPSDLENTETIQCMVRIRPLIPEIESRGRICVELNESNNMITIDCKPKEKSFTFDHCGPIHSTQESIFQTVGKPISNACLSGYNGTIFAYGQTGSGKTFTILGDFEDKNSSRRGLMPRVFDYLFCQIQRHRSKMGADRVEYLVKCSCLEIYNERIQDLIEPDRHNLSIREDIKRGVIVEGLSYKICETANDALDLINLAGRNRRVSATSMNKESSRSHLMFTLMIECRITDTDTDTDTSTNNNNNNNTQQKFQTPVFTHTRSRTNRNENKKLVRTRTSRFNLVDLAGSERQSKTNAKGDRLREAGNINKSLTVLGHVMKALVQRSTDDKNTHRHIHYRDSKLTHLLKDSLGGNSLTFMIACISPSSMNLLESLGTLQFASRAKFIKNKAQLNEDQSGSVQVLKCENLKLINEVEKLKKKLRRLKNSNGSVSSSFIMNGNTNANKMEVDGDGDGGDNESVDADKLKDACEILERENYSIRRERERLKKEIDELGKVIDKKQQFVMSLKMQLKLRETESVKLRNAIEAQMVNSNVSGERIRNDIIARYESEERDRKQLLLDPSCVVEERVRNMELQQQSQQMMDFIHRFIDDKDNKFRYDQYVKWKNTYQILVDQNEELREDMRENENESLKLLAVKEKMVEPKIEQYETQISSLNNQISEIEQQNKQNTDTLQQEINTVQNSKQDLQNKHNDLQNNYAELESKIQLEERQYLMEKQAMKDEYEKQLENMRQGAVRALDSNNEHNTELKMQIAQLNAKMEATEKELMDTQSQFRQQTKYVQNITNDLNNAKQSFSQMQNANSQQTQHISQLNNIINDKNNDMQSLKQTMSQMEDEQNANQSLLKESRTINQELENKIGEKHSNINRLEAELETITQQFADLKLQYESLMDDHQILNDVQSTLEYQKRELDDKMEQCIQDINELKQKNNDLCEQIEHKNNIISNLKEEASQKMLNKDEMVKNINKKNENLLKTIDDMNEEIDGLKHSLKESQNEMLRKDIDIEGLKKEMCNINGQLTDYKSAYNELENKYSAYVQKYKQLDGELADTQHKCDNYNTALIDKNIKLQQLFEQNEILQNESDAFQRQTAKTITSFNDKISELQNEICMKQKQYDDDMKQWQCNQSQMNMAHRNEMNQKQQCIETLQNEVVKLKQNMSQQIQSLNNSLIENEKESMRKLREIEKEHKEKCDELNSKLMEMNNNNNKISKEYGIMKCKYENEKCKLSEKERTLQLLQQQLSQFSMNGNQLGNGENNNEHIGSQMSKVFEQFNHEQIKLNEEITQLNNENQSLKQEIDNMNGEKQKLNMELIAIKKENNLAKESFELHKKNMCEQLDRANADIQLRQNRSERLIKTFEQRLELRQKQNVDYREKIDQLSANITHKTSVIQKQQMEISQIRDQLKRCQHTVANAQSLNETLLSEKAIFDSKLEDRDAEIEEITNKHNKLLSDLLICNKQREDAIKTSQRMRLAEEKAYNDMFEWKTKYNNVQETSQRIINEKSELKKRNENLLQENSKLAGHHNAQQRINHLLNLKKECEKLKKDKKQLLNKVSLLQRKLGNSSNNNNLNVSSTSNMNISNISSITDIKEQLTQMSASKDEMSSIISKILHKIRNINNNNELNEITNVNNIEQHFSVLHKIQNVINEQNNKIIKLKRDVNGLENDLNIRDEQIKLLKDKIVLTPTVKLQKKSISKLSIQKRKRRASSYHNNDSTNYSKSTTSKKRHSTDNFNFD